MIAVVQRVRRAAVTIDDPPYEARIEEGLCVLLGVEEGDEESDAEWMAGKLARLRIFRDDADLMNRSVVDVGGAVLLVSQFTLAGDCRKGNRPSFVHAAGPVIGKALYESVAERLRDAGLPVATGMFGAMMTVTIENDGPVTLIVRTPPKPGREH